MSDESLDGFLAESRERVEQHLDKALPPASEPPAVLHEAMRYAVFSPGKRLRPAIAFGAAVAAGAEPEVALPVAAAVELIHSYSLVHDDLPCMDDDFERRGQPTVHARFGEADALLTGDALLTAAFAELAGVPDPGNQVGRAGALVGRLAQAAGSRALVGGQVDDLNLDPASATVASINSIHLRKTAALFRFSAVGGGALAGLPEFELESLDRFGRAYGLAFQLVDDLLDDDPDECSILRVMGANEAHARASELISEAIGALVGFGARNWVLQGLAGSLTGRLR